MTELKTIDGGQKNALPKRANIKKVYKVQNIFCLKPWSTLEAVRLKFQDSFHISKSCWFFEPIGTLLNKDSIYVMVGSDFVWGSINVSSYLQ